MNSLLRIKNRGLAAQTCQHPGCREVGRRWRLKDPSVGRRQRVWSVAGAMIASLVLGGCAGAPNMPYLMYQQETLKNRPADSVALVGVMGICHTAGVSIQRPDVAAFSNSIIHEIPPGLNNLRVVYWMVAGNTTISASMDVEINAVPGAMYGVCAQVGNRFSAQIIPMGYYTEKLRNKYLISSRGFQTKYPYLFPDEENFEPLRHEAEKGVAKAQIEMGENLMKGTVMKKDPAEACQWFRKAAEQKHAAGQNLLGTCYLTGQGEKQDDSEAFKWVQKAANQGHAGGQNNLGLLFRDGKGVKQSYGEAFKWFQKAAGQGNEFAQYNLSQLYAEGKGAKQNLSESMQWLQKAAQSGFAPAQFDLGKAYHHGTGVGKDPVEAYKWYTLAQKSPAISTQERFDLSKLMTAAQITEAEERVRQWRPANSQ